MLRSPRSPLRCSQQNLATLYVIRSVYSVLILFTQYGTHWRPETLRERGGKVNNCVRVTWRQNMTCNWQTFPSFFIKKIRFLSILQYKYVPIHHYINGAASARCKGAMSHWWGKSCVTRLNRLYLSISTVWLRGCAVPIVTCINIYYYECGKMCSVMEKVIYFLYFFTFMKNQSCESSQADI